MSGLLVVEHHVRQPDVFRGQPDLHHPVKLLRDPSQTVVLPLLRVSKDKMLSHSHTHRTKGEIHLERSTEGEEEARPSVSQRST